MESNIMDLIHPGLIVVIAVLVILGLGLKNTTLIKDKYIPLALGAVSVLLCGAALIIQAVPVTGGDWLGLAFDSFTQGILCAGVAVYGNQVVKQLGKKE